MLVSDKSQEGAQFISAFGGIGATLRYKVETEESRSEVEDFSDEDIF